MLLQHLEILHFCYHFVIPLIVSFLPSESTCQAIRRNDNRKNDWSPFPLAIRASKRCRRNFLAFPQSSCTYRVNARCFSYCCSPWFECTCKLIRRIRGNAGLCHAPKLCLTNLGLSLADVIPWNTAHSTWVKLLENVPSNVSFLTQCCIFNFSSELLPKNHDCCMITLSESSKLKTNHKK